MFRFKLVRTHLPMMTLCFGLLIDGATAAAASCDDNFDPRGKIIGYSHPDGDPIYENLGPVEGRTPDGEPIYAKTKATYGHHRGRGNVTGYTADSDPLYDGEQRPKYTIDGERVTPLRAKRTSSGWDE